jgi:aerobic C4-dicarboxylate transport protein
MEELETVGCSKAPVGVPTSYTFNTDGTNLCMALAALFVAQGTEST